MLKRLFIQFPLYVIFMSCLCTGIIPVLYWIITGNDPSDFFEKIENL